MLCSEFKSPSSHWLGTPHTTVCFTLRPHMLMYKNVMYRLRSGDLMIKAGEWKLLGQNPKEPQVRPVTAIARHPGYDSGSLAKDLAILVLAQPFIFNVHVDKICVPSALGSEYFQKRGQNCVITGWGKNSLNGKAHKNRT